MKVPLERALSGRMAVAILLVLVSIPAFGATPIAVNTNADVIHDGAHGFPGGCAEVGTGTCSLRDAIIWANLNGAAGEPYNVDFSGIGTPLIQLAAANGGLDIINVKMVIDGTTSGSKVELDGSLLSGSSNGLTLNAQCTVKGMVIHSFGGDGINIQGGGGLSVILGNFIGTNVLGATASPNGSNGITVDAPGVTVNSNTISGNSQTGIDILGFTTTGVNVQNNKIGTDQLGITAVGNGFHGIRIRSAAFAITIGGANVISGNTGHGVFIDGSASPPTANVVSGNFIGTRMGGLGALPNSQDGVHISQSDNNIIGGPPLGGNIISGNTGSGIVVDGSSNNTIIVSNLIGLDSTAVIALADGNGGDGILLKTVTNTAVGGPGGLATRNYISFNTGAGVHISGQVGTTTGNVVEGNFIGTNLDGSNSGSPGNGGGGIFVEGSAAQNNTIGGSSGASPGLGNTIAFNTGAGIRIGVNIADTVGPIPILTNSTHDNTGLGIDLGNDGVTPNGVGPGSNNLQNYPVLSLALLSTVSGNVLLKGTQPAASAAPNELQFFIADTAPPANGEGKTFILDVSGIADGPFTVGPSAPATAVAVGNPATVTSTTVDGTSEFSANLAFVANALPVANAGPPQSATTGATITLNGSASNDPDSLPNGPTILNGNFTWTQTGGPAVALTNGTSSGPSFVAATPGTYVFSLVVSDGMDLSTNLSTVTITVMSTSNTALVSSLNPSVFGQSVTFTATVTGTGPTPTGNVTFMDGVTPIGTVALNGAAQAALTTSALAVGSHNITAVYAGDANFTGSTSPVVVQVVNKASTTPVLVSSVNPSVFGQSVTFTATVSATAPGAGTPTGTVTFFDGVTPLGVPVALNGAGQATLTTSALAVGSHPITFQYAGDGNFNGSTSAILTQTVNPAATTTTVISSLNPSTFGQSVTFTATVSPVAPGAGTPTGNATFFDGVTPLGTVALNGSAQAAFTTSALTVGSHSITVQYLGDTNFTGSTSTVLTQVVNPAVGIPSATAVVSSVNPSVFGQSVTFTATVTGAGPIPTGTVNFLDGVTLLGTAALNGAGQATFTTSALSVGSHSITGSYSGDATYAPSVSPILTQVVNQAGTTTTVISSLNPSTFGQSVTFTATVAAVAPGAGTPTGNATFFDGVTPLGTVALNGSAQAAFTTSALTVGSHSITVQYLGDTNFIGSTSTVLTQVVNPAAGLPSNTAVVSSVNPSVFGQAVTFTATVTGGGPVPTGTVNFMNGVTLLGTAALNGAAQATFTTSALAVGSHSITGVYSGDGSYAASTSPIVTQVVNQASTTSTVVSSLNPSQFGQSVTFTATVAAVPPGAGTPTGTVTFFDGITSIGTGALNGSGQATFTTSTLTVGSHPITAQYGGDANFTASVSAILTQTVNPAAGLASTTAVVSSVNPSVFGQAVTFTATVTGGGPVPTGTVNFMDGVTLLGTATLNGAAQATFTTSALAVGSHSITGVYSGDGSYAASTSPVLTQVVNKAATATTVTSTINPSTVGQSVTFTATVTATAPGAGIPTGTASFFDGITLLGTAALNGSGIATFTTSALTAGTHPITASYSGDANFNTSVSGILSQVVNAAGATASTTTITSSANPSTVGQSVTFTATVTGSGPTPTGTVTFLDGATTLGTGTLGAGGQATFATSALTAGSHTITASYGGNATYSSSSAQLTQVVNALIPAIPVLDPRTLLMLAIALGIIGIFVLGKRA